MFPNPSSQHSAQQKTYYTDPLLVTSSVVLQIPTKATKLLAFLGGGGASGCYVASGLNAGGGSGGFGAVEIDLKKLAAFTDLRKPSTISLTVPAAANGVTSINSPLTGNAGSDCVLTLPGGYRITAGGGAAVPATGNGTSGVFTTGTSKYSFNIAIDHSFALGRCLQLFDGCAVSVNGYLRYGIAASATGATLSGDAYYHGAGCTPATPGTAYALSSIVLPWWVSQAGLTIGTLGSSSGQGTAGAGGFNGVSGAGGDNANAGNATGYCAGGGSVGLGTTTATSGKGAPGVAVIMWEVQA